MKHRAFNICRLAVLIATGTCALPFIATSCSTVDHIFYEDGDFDNNEISDDIIDTLERNNDLDLDQEEHN